MHAMKLSATIVEGETMVFSFFKININAGKALAAHFKVERDASLLKLIGQYVQAFELSP